MQLTDIHRIVGAWYATGQLSEFDRAALKSQYLGDTGGQVTCTVCPNFWRDLQTHFRILLKQNNMKTNTTRKYRLNPETGYLRLPGQQQLIVNEGEESESVTVLTDVMGAQILKEIPELKSQIQDNPDYVSPVAPVDPVKTK